MISTVGLEDAEWQYVLSMLATHKIMTDPVTQKMSAQLSEQQAQRLAKGNGHAAEGFSERPDQGALPPRVEAAQPPTDHSHSPKQRQARPPKG